MFVKAYFATALLGVLLIGAPAQATVILDQATAFTRAAAVIYTSAPRPSIQTNQSSASLQAGDDTVEASVSTLNQNAGKDRAFAHEDVFASIDSPYSGTIDFSGNTASRVLSGAAEAQAYNDGSSFNYDFTLTSSYVFNVDYTLAETDSFYPDNYYQLISLSGGSPLLSGNPADGSYYDPTTDSASILLGPGTYEFGITSKLGDISDAYLSGSSVGSHMDEYAFNLTAAVPETATWLMMILGFGAIGGVMRRAHRKSEERFTAKVRTIATA